MDEKTVIEVTEKDMVEALAHACAKDESLNKLISSSPMLLLVFPIVIKMVWKALVEMKEEKENDSGTTEDRKVVTSDEA